MRSATLILAELALILFTLTFTRAYNNGVGRAPPMGWNSWNLFACDINEQLIIETIDAMDSKLKKFGYQYVNIDDCWSLKSNRDPVTNEMIPDPVRFPRGIKFLADYAHSKGLKLGIYSDVGDKTCQGYPGSANHYEIDAKTFAKWEVDYLKLDWCFVDDAIKAEPWKYYGRMSARIKQYWSSHLLLNLQLVGLGVSKPHEWAPKIANSWRTTGDINSSWKSVLEILDLNKPLWKYSGPYAFNDPDMLEVEVDRPPNKLTIDESRTHFTLWCMLNSPLLLGNDIRRLDDQDRKWAKDIITNEEVIAVSQDPFVKQAQLLYETKVGTFNQSGACTSSNCTWIEVWMKPLQKTQTIAVAVYNRAGLNIKDPKFKAESANIIWKSLGLEEDLKLSVRDLWAHSDKGSFQKEYTTDKIAPHDVRLYSMSGSGWNRK
ncbi:alpha-galactosidase [Acrasis kona]|uniref:Alpha-galactosidase n=1 Tax=Acrasis kona TaxID=1008807 RepID=A0AAW2YMF9_9EUKA